MPLHKKSIFIRAQIKKPCDIFGIFPRNHCRREHNNIHWQLNKFAGNGVFRLDNQTSRLITAFRHARAFTANEFNIFFDYTIIKFFISFARRADIDIKLINVGGCFFLEQVSELK